MAEQMPSCFLFFLTFAHKKTRLEFLLLFFFGVAYMEQQMRGGAKVLRTSNKRQIVFIIESPVAFVKPI